MPLHQRIAIHHIDAPNALATTSKRLITKYVTQHTHRSISRFTIPFTHTHTHTSYPSPPIHQSINSSRRGALLHCPPHPPLCGAPVPASTHLNPINTPPHKSGARTLLTTTTTTYTRIHPVSQPASHTTGHSLTITITTLLRRASADTYSP